MPLNILISNDDGIAAEGIHVLARRLSGAHHVTVAAPMHQQSGTSHALTIGRAIEVREDENFDAECHVAAWAIDGTPTDCAKLYLDAITEERPDVVLSGINHGSNLGTDVIYSGTVVADAADSFFPVMEQVLAAADQPFLLNINFPKELAGDEPRFVFCRQGGRDYVNAFERIEMEEGRVHYKVAGEVSDTDKGIGTDIYAVEHGLIAVTPLGVDMTDYPLLRQLGDAL